MGWLAGWHKRIKLTVDNTKIDATLSHFPVTVFLTSTHGDCVFDELMQDANRKKIAFTKSDETTELYGEIEKWDDVNEEAIIHVSLSGWSLSSSTNTDFYMYYDVSHADNDTYIGDIDSTPGHSVWDSNFKFVCHMVDCTGDTVKDSTSNGYDGSKSSSDNPLEVTGGVGKGQDFSADAIRLIGATPTINILTLEAVCKFDAVDGERWLITRDDTGTTGLDWWWGNKNGKLRVLGTPGGSFGTITETTNVIISTGILYHAAFTWDASSALQYVDGAPVAASSAGTGNFDSSDEINIGANSHGASCTLDGIADEMRISDNVRSAAWIKATNYTLRNTLLTYSAEEESVFVPQIIMF